MTMVALQEIETRVVESTAVKEGRQISPFLELSVAAGQSIRNHGACNRSKLSGSKVILW